MKNKSVLIVVTILLIGLVSLWGCPKKAEMSATSDMDQEKAQALSGAEAEREADGGNGAMAGAGTAAASKGLKPIYYDYDRSFVRDDAREVMKANGAWLKANSKAKVRIEGNCDERGTREYNQALGQRRAESAKKYLLDMGISANRISILSYGKEKPVCNDATEACWQKNRRGDLIAVTE